MKKKVIDFREKLKTFMDDVQSEFENGKDRGLLILHYDGELPDNKCALNGLILGSKEALDIGGAMLMEKNEEARDVLSDIVSFYNFKKNPKAGLVKMLADTLDDLADDLKKLKGKQNEEKAD